ncbi:histidinol-phosphate transaminase [Moraxella sp. FZFQ2102]|uniref:histidinol-phosphate transaminase n=1 Tax=Moraxella sp. FZFQ2102 TaxID=2953752 RepID=UPI00209BC67F|nr:histidinol-phosphate transaminase [Moraxella sp. FZFQ2102]USZ15619.1 histidinol-phosphate transaminase [Moraxella sp. FZFQ2102]
MTIDNRLWSTKAKSLTPYVPGEQPKHDNLCKLNTNENPFPPSPKAVAAMQVVLADDAAALRLYPEPESDGLRQALAAYYGLDSSEVFVGNGSDEVLALVFACFFTKDKPLLTPDISYSFYPVYADTFGVAAQTVPLADDFSIHVADYAQPCDGVILANPNAPTGRLLPLDDIRTLLSQHPDAVVVIDEAYIDYADDVKAASAISLIREFDNLVVTQTFSKSRALAGLRVGMAFANPSLIAALTAMKNSFNSYPLDRVAQAGAAASVADVEYFESRRTEVIHLRNQLTADLTALGFDVLPSAANFVFATKQGTDAADIAAKLREDGVIVRHFKQARIKDYLRISVGTAAQNARLIEVLKQVL